jgi:hypothetical protein
MGGLGQTITVEMAPPSGFTWPRGYKRRSGTMRWFHAVVGVTTLR